MTEVEIGTAESICPECLRRIPARKIKQEDQVYLVKHCPEHGLFRTLIWQGEPAYESWGQSKLPSPPLVCATPVDKGCPFDCGLCPKHRQQPCCVLLEITERCNLQCPVCFASTELTTPDPSIEVIESWYRMLLASGGPYNIQLSGGEPTLRDDLPEIIQLGHQLGFGFIQINTNGVRLASDSLFVEQLKTAGLNCVFLQFDGLSDEIYQTIRGTELLQIKMAAIANCEKYGIGVVLVPTLVPGVNTDQIGKIIRFAVQQLPTVRGVHFQPISYFGRYPALPPQERLTIPQIIREIEQQSLGKLKAANFLPPGGENSYCSFHGNFILLADGEMRPWATFDTANCCAKALTAGDGAQSAQEFVAKQWTCPQSCENKPAAVSPAAKGTSKQFSGMDTTSMDDFLERVHTHTLAISGMAFQDAWNVELDRLRDCLIHVVSPAGKLIPFCAYNLTASDGRSLYRRRG